MTETNNVNIEKVNTDKNIVILYHANCLDGLAAAWVAKRYFEDKAEYVPVKSHEAFPQILNINNEYIDPAIEAEMEIYIVDFSYPYAEISKAEQRYKKVVTIDHHISVEAEVKSTREHLYELDHSGCYLAWRYFYPDTPVPLLPQYISEGDIHRYTLPNHEDYMPAIYGREYNFDNVDELYTLMETEAGRKKLREQSVLLSQYENKILAPALNSIHWVVLDGVTMPAVNVCLPIDERSDLLQRIYTAYPPVALSYRWDEGEWKCSLRSNGEFDCTVIAKNYGGGGHRGAAGFAVSGDMPLPFAKVESN